MGKGKLGDPRKLKTSPDVPLAILVSAGEYLENKGWFDGFQSAPFGEKQERLSRFLWQRHKPSLKIESLVFRALQKIATEGVDAWNANPELQQPQIQLLAAPPCRWPENLDSTCRMMVQITGAKENYIKDLLLNF